MALILPSRSTRIVQPSGPVEIDKSYGLTPIGVFLGSAGAVDIVTGQRFTRGAALAIAPSQIGLGARQNAVNTGLHRAVPELQSVSDYTAIWHGVPIGEPVGASPEFVGITSSATSQNRAIVGIRFTNSTTLTVGGLSSSTSIVRAGTFTWASVYGRAVTLMASYSSEESRIRLRICADGITQDLVDSAVSGGMLPQVLGTEQFIVGPDVAEQPTRHINAHVGFAGVFYGRLRGDVVQKVLRNPWQLFKPQERSIIIDLGAGGGPVGEVSAALDTTDQSDTASGNAAALVDAGASITDQADSLSASAEVAASGLSAALDVTDQADSIDASTTAAVSLAATLTDEADAVAGAAVVALGAAATLQDEADTLAAAAEVVAAGGVLVSAELTDQPDTVAADAEVNQPLPSEDPVSLGGHRRRNWRTFDTLPSWGVTASAQITDDADTVAAGVEVAELEAVAVQAGAALLDDSDQLFCMAAVRWPAVGLVRASGQMIRTKAGAAA